MVIAHNVVIGHIVLCRSYRSEFRSYRPRFRSYVSWGICDLGHIVYNSNQSHSQHRSQVTGTRTASQTQSLSQVLEASAADIMAVIW